MQTLIDCCNNCGDYTPTTDNTLQELKTFFDFSYLKFEDHPKYEKMFPTSNQPAQLIFNKTHKFRSPDIITNPLIHSAG